LFPPQRIYAYGFIREFIAYWATCDKKQLYKSRGKIMTHHAALWAAVNHIAKINNISCSCLACRCGLDSTTFNPSKRFSSHGQPRWVSTETLYKILRGTNITPIEFANIFQSFLDQE